MPDRQVVIGRGELDASPQRVIGIEVPVRALGKVLGETLTPTNAADSFLRCVDTIAAAATRACERRSPTPGSILRLSFGDLAAVAAAVHRHCAGPDPI